MTATDDRQPLPDDEITLSDIILWITHWWWIVLCGALAGLLLGLICHLAVEPNFTVRTATRITETPVNTPDLIRDMSANFLRKQAGTNVAVEVNTRTQVVSLIEQNVPAESVAVRQAAMQNAVAALNRFLEDTVSYEFALMQERYAGAELPAEAYASLANFRLYLAAVKDGLLEPVVIVSESAKTFLPSLLVLLLIGALFGAVCGVLTALAVDALRRSKALLPTRSPRRA